MPKKTDFIRVFGAFSPDKTKHVSSVELVVMVEDVIIRNDANQDVPIYFTDIQIQPGDTLTGWVPKTDEMITKLPIVIDEGLFVPSHNVMNGAQPQIMTLPYRTFNIVGRGHQTITVPNYYPEDWEKEILPTGLDITLFAKDDFELCRISTAVGCPLPEENQIPGLLSSHPLNYKYTREFWIDGASAGAEIKVHASTQTATLNGAAIPIAGQRTVDINGTPFYIGRKRFILAPVGSVRFRVEFYNTVGGVLSDAGIGYYGTASIVQWTYGRATI